MLSKIIALVFPAALVQGLKPRAAIIRGKDWFSLVPLAFPGVGFAMGLCWAVRHSTEYAWLKTPRAYPWELWLIALSGSVATLGGVGDWLFHRAFYTVGPKEHKSHLWALAGGGVPLFLLMCWASASSQPKVALIPILLAALLTTVLICYDEFVFHRRRCKALETLLHRLLVFGNGTAWLAWMHWCFVSR